MKRTIIFSAFMAILLSAVYTSAQTSGVRLSFSEGTTPGGVPTGTVTFIVDGAPVVMQVFEALIPAATEAACFASRDFSMARPVGPDRASVVYDAGTGSYKLQWTGVRDKKDSCRVLLVGQSLSATDLAAWQANYGAGGFADDQSSYGEAARVNKASCQLMLASASSDAIFSVIHPAQDDEVVEVGFPAEANSNFRLLEGTFPASSDAECLANQDFSAMTPVGSDRATIGFVPSSGLWFLRNTNAGAPTEPCHALLLNGDNTVDAADYLVWRSAFGNTLLAGDDRLLKESAGSIDQDARQPGTSSPGTVITYTFTVTNTSSAGLFLR